MKNQAAKTYSEQLLDIKELYLESGEPWPATARQIAIWAINNGYYQRHRDKLIAKAAEEFADAMREQYHTDAKGRRVRTLHVARIVSKSGDGKRTQRMMWDDIRTAKRSHMERAFQLRRRNIVGDCRQLKTDVDSYNDNHPDEKPIQLLLDFSVDVVEANEPEYYRPGRPR